MNFLLLLICVENTQTATFSQWKKYFLLENN